MRSVVWFRGKDLRLADHEALSDAVARGEVIPLFVLDPYFFAPARARRIPHRIQFLLESLADLAESIEHRGSRLLIVEGRSVDVVPRLACAWRADRVVAQRWTAPLGRERDRRVAAALHVPLELFEGETLHAPGTARTQEGRPFSVFTPFARAIARTLAVGRPLAAPRKLPALPHDVRAEAARIPSCEDLGFSRKAGLLRGGERAAASRLRDFLDGRAADYPTLRNRMDLDGTSRLSADLKFGTLSVRTVWAEAESSLSQTAPAALRAIRNELLWREFGHSTLWDRPDLLERPFRSDWGGFPWRRDDTAWRAWADGRTGFPVVDAAARQLLAEGFVHNRARMIAASFFCKDLMIDFRQGEAHYLDTLVDGDWAQNDLNWQWSAGCGCDAQPYFRIFNPVTQGLRFDPTGDYVRRWVPELARLPTRYVHRPWLAPADVLRTAGVRLGASYPTPIVDHDVARRRFLETVREGRRERGGDVRRRARASRATRGRG